MSRKTRKLMWSAPLIAAVAVIGALAAFVILGPGGAQAHEPVRDAMGVLKSTPHLPPDPVTDIDVMTPSIADGGRTSLQVSWNAPTGGDPVATYRLDISTDTDVWHNVIGGEESGKDTLTEGDAMSNCTSDDDGNRCYTVTGLDSDTQYHFRVFAMNEHGTSGISVDETFASGTTLAIDPPAKATGLDATDYFTDQIVVSWDAVTNTGGADVLWYCVGVAPSPNGAFIDLANTTDADQIAACKNATEEADVGAAGITALLADSPVSQTAVVAAMDENGDPVTSWTHDGLGGGNHDDDDGTTPELPHEIELRYRLYAVTSESGDMSKTDDRRIARAASEVATGSTVRPANVPDPKAASPGRVGNLRAVAYTTATVTDGALPDPTVGTQHLHFFWTHPEGFVADTDPDTANNQPNWRVEVQRRVAKADDHPDYTDWLPVTPDASPAAAVTGYGIPQFDVDFTDVTANVFTAGSEAYLEPVLWGADASHPGYRVRYVNMAGTADDTSDDVPGTWATITIPAVTTDYVLADADLAAAFDTTTTPTTTLPIVRISGATSNATPGLRFEHLEGRDGRDHIKLVWDRNDNGRTPTKQPNGYVIDRSGDGGTTWQTLARADNPRDLGATNTFTDDHEVVPGKAYQYRVFPVFIQTGPDAYGAPAIVNAASRGADRPQGVRNLRVMADGQQALDLSWDPPVDDGGHEVKGYLVQWALDEDGDPGTTWTDAALEMGNTDPLTTKVTMEDDGTSYNFKPTDGATPPVLTLTAGSMRWFRVIPITNENDGDQETGGTAVSISSGEVLTGATIDPDDLTAPDALPHVDDATRADPVKGTTEGLGDAEADKQIAPPAAPVDLTAEAASNSNALGDGDRGVFLTWNQVEMPDTETNSYRIERQRMNTGIDALNSKDADEDGEIDWEFMTRVSDITSWTDDDDLRQDGEMRYYRVGSEATGVADPSWVMMSVGYALHMNHAPDAPMNVMAMSSADGTMITVTWDDPGSTAATSPVTR